MVKRCGRKPITAHVMTSNSFLLTAEDFALFERYERSVSYSDVSKEDRSLFDSLRMRLREVADQAALAYRGHSKLKVFVSKTNPSGRTPKSLWCCIFPEESANKSYAMQVALIVSKKGVEICLCLGSGEAEVRDATTLQKLQQEFRRIQERLARVPDNLISQLLNNSRDKYYLRKQWRLEETINDFPNFKTWLRYASSTLGKSASISMYFTPA